MSFSLGLPIFGKEKDGYPEPQLYHVHAYFKNRKIVKQMTSRFGHKLTKKFIRCHISMSVSARARSLAHAFAHIRIAKVQKKGTRLSKQNGTKQQQNYLRGIYVSMYEIWLAQGAQFDLIQLNS